jgi:hypothetical protein
MYVFLGSPPPASAGGSGGAESASSARRRREGNGQRGAAMTVSERARECESDGEVEDERWKRQ